jgi:hypothetical protein
MKKVFLLLAVSLCFGIGNKALSQVVGYTYYGTVESQSFALNVLQTPFDWERNNILLFPDSMVVKSVIRIDDPNLSSSSRPFHAMGFVFDPYTKTFSRTMERGLFEDEIVNGLLYGYKIDTVTVRGEYRRTSMYAGNPDTLRVYVSHHDVYRRKSGSVSTEYSLYNWPEAPWTRLLTPKIKYTLPIPDKGLACVPAAASLQTFDYILQANDTNTGLLLGEVGSKSFAVG